MEVIGSELRKATPYTRITVQDVLEYLAAGMTETQILSDFPSLTSDSIRAVLAFAAARERSWLPQRPDQARAVLIDENLSPKLVAVLQSAHPGSTHVEHSASEAGSTPTSGRPRVKAASRS